MGRRHTRAARQSKSNKDLTWTAVATERQLISTTTTSLDIVQDADWNATAGRQSATLLTIRGSIAFDRVLANAGAVFMYIGLFDKDEGSAIPLNASTYVEEDLLWTNVFSYQTLMAEPYVIDIHVKAKRRIATGREVRLVFQEGGTTNSMVLSCVLRALLNKANG